MSVISLLLPKAEMELKLRVVKSYHMSRGDLTRFYLSTATICNKFPVVKPSPFTTISDMHMIGHFHEIYLNLSCNSASLVVVVKH